MSKQRKDRELAKNGAITEEAMLAYLNNELTVEEKQQFEKLLAEDPFASDAMEGLQASQKAVIVTHLSSINKKVKSKAGLREGKTISIHWANYAWAAAILGLLIGIGFIMIGYMNKENNTIAENAKQDTETNLIGNSSEPAPAEAQQLTDSAGTTTDSLTLTYTNAAATSDSISINPNMASGLAATNAAQSATGTITTKAPAVTQQSAANNNTANLPAANKPATVTATGATTDKSVATRSTTDDIAKNTGESANAELKKSKKAEEKADSKTPAITPNAATVKEVGPASGGASAPAVDENTTVDQAMSNFNKGNYKESAAQFDVILKKQPDNKEALYFGGVSDYINGKTSKSEKNFDKLLNSGSGYVEGSKWYKANILLQKGKKEEAKKILNELSNGNGSYKERAANKLKEIN